MYQTHVCTYLQVALCDTTCSKTCSLLISTPVPSSLQSSSTPGDSSQLSRPPLQLSYNRRTGRWCTNLPAFLPSCLPAFLPSCHAALHPTRLVNHLSPVLPEVWTEIYLFTVPVHTLSWIDTTDRLIIIVGAGTCTRQG